MADTIKISVEIPIQTLRDLLCTAVEGGSNYWANFSHATQTEGLDYLSVKVIEHTISKGDRRMSKIVKAEDLAKGIERLAQIAYAEDGVRAASFPAAGKHFADALDNHDATTADVVLQMTVFGELVYG